MKRLKNIYATLLSFSILGCSSFGSKPEGEYLEAIKSSPQFKGEKFGNVPPTVDTMEMGMFSLLWEFLFQKP